MTPNGDIFFSNDRGEVGCMPVADYKAHFSAIQKVPPKIHLKWTSWRWSGTNRCEFCTNGKTVKVRAYGFVGRASCSPGDAFDLDYGIRLAKARARYKAACADQRELLELWIGATDEADDALSCLESIENESIREAKQV